MGGRVASSSVIQIGIVISFELRTSTIKRDQFASRDTSNLFQAKYVGSRPVKSHAYVYTSYAPGLFGQVRLRL